MSGGGISLIPAQLRGKNEGNVLAPKEGYRLIHRSRFSQERFFKHIPTTGADSRSHREIGFCTRAATIHQGTLELMLRVRLQNSSLETGSAACCCLQYQGKETAMQAGSEKHSDLLILERSIVLV